MTSIHVVLHMGLAVSPMAAAMRMKNICATTLAATSTRIPSVKRSLVRGDPSCPGDYDNSGNTDVEDVLWVIEGWGNPYNVENLLSVIEDWNCSEG